MKRPATSETLAVRRILVVEDDPSCRDVYAAALEAEGYVVCTADDGAEALRVLEGLPEPPDAIVLDLMMPVMDGWEVLERLRERPQWSSIPVLVTSAAHTPRLGNTAARFLAKPVDLDRFLSALQACVVDHDLGRNSA